MKLRGFAFLLSELEVVEHEIAFAVPPFFAVRGATKPSFPLEEVKEDDATEQLLHEIAQRFAGAVELLLFVARDRDAEKPFRDVGFPDQIIDEMLVTFLVFGEEFLVQPLD